MRPGRVFAAVLGAGLIVLVAWAVFGAVGRLAVEVPLAHLRVSAMINAALLILFDWFLVLFVLSLLLTFSFLLTPGGAERVGTRLIVLAKPVLVMIVVAGVINGLWFALLGPRAELRLQQISHQSRTARESLAEARRLLDQELWTNAEEHLLLYQALVGETEDVLDLLRQTRAGQIADEQERRIVRERPATETPWVSEATEMSVAQLMTRAREFLAQRDYFSAHHFATLAVEQSRTPRQDARSLQAEALNAIERGSLARDEAEARQLYRDKVAAYEAFRRGETIPEQALEAYYRFQELEQRIPDDPDVRRFAPEARRRAAEISFFLEEARSNHALPGRSNIVFVNRRTGEGVELVTVDRLVRVRAGDFLYGIEIMRTGRGATGGETMLHAQALYGKVIGNRLVMRAVSREGDFRDGDANILGPQLISGSPSDLGGALVLNHTVDDIVRFGGGRDAMATLTLADLFGLSSRVERLGQSPGTAEEALVERILRISGFFIVAFGAIALGWYFRSRYIGRPPLKVLLLVPLILWIVWRVVEILRFFVAAVSLALPMGVALSGMVIALVIVFFLLARQTVDI